LRTEKSREGPQKRTKELRVLERKSSIFIQRISQRRKPTLSAASP
jgi:hypothetical protein